MVEVIRSGSQGSSGKVSEKLCGQGRQGEVRRKWSGQGNVREKFSCQGSQGIVKRKCSCQGRSRKSQEDIEWPGKSGDNGAIREVRARSGEIKWPEKSGKCRENAGKY